MRKGASIGAFHPDFLSASDYSLAIIFDISDLMLGSLISVWVCTSSGV
jgi:hypothetical protein